MKRGGHHKNLKIIHGDSLHGLRGDIILLSMVLHEVDTPKEFFRVVLFHWNPMDELSLLTGRKWKLEPWASSQRTFSKEEVLQFTSMKHREHHIHEWVYFLELMKN